MKMAEISAQDAIASINLRVTVKKPWTMDLRIWLAFHIIRFGGWVAGFGRTSIE